MTRAGLCATVTPAGPLKKLQAPEPSSSYRCISSSGLQRGLGIYMRKIFPR